MTSDKTTVIKSNTDIFKQITESSHRIDIFFQGKEYSFTREQLPISIGRDAQQCNITSGASTASRLHCHIALKDNQIGIDDTSTNGTYIKIGRADTILIKNSFYPLANQGHIGLGEPIDLQSAETIHFRVSSDTTKTAK